MSAAVTVPRSLVHFLSLALCAIGNALCDSGEWIGHNFYRTSHRAACIVWELENRVSDAFGLRDDEQL